MVPYTNGIGLTRNKIIQIEEKPGFFPETQLRDRRPNTAACPAWCAMGIKELKQCTLYSEEKIFCARPPRAAKAEQKSLVPAWQANEPTKGGPLFHLYSLSPHSSQFQQTAGATPLSSLWYFEHHSYLKNKFLNKFWYKPLTGRSNHWDNI